MSNYVRHALCIYFNIFVAISSCGADERLEDIEKFLKDQTKNALNEVAKEWNVTPEQLERIKQMAEQERASIWDYIGERNTIFGTPKHDNNFPTNMMKKVANRENVDISNLKLQCYVDSYANNATGGSDAFATANYAAAMSSHYIKRSRSADTWYEYRSIPLSGTIKDEKYFFNGNYPPQIVSIYPTFYTVSSEEKEAILVHELEHIIQRHCFLKGLLCQLIVDKHKVPSVKVIKSKSGKKLENACEQEANILPAVRHSDVAELLASICNNKDRKILSNSDCSHIRTIYTLHQKK